MSTWVATAKPRRKPGRPPGRRNSVRYREHVARGVLTLRIPAEAPARVKALGAEARAILEKAIRSTDRLAFCRARTMAAIYVLRDISRRATAADLIDDVK